MNFNVNNNRSFAFNQVKRLEVTKDSDEKRFRTTIYDAKAPKDPPEIKTNDIPDEEVPL